MGTESCHGSNICKGAEVVRSVLFAYSLVLTDVTSNEMMLFNHYSVDHKFELKHVSDYS